MRTGLATFAFLVLSSAVQAQTCPAVVQNATRLALVTANGMQTSSASLALYTREKPGAPWRQAAAAGPVRLGQFGLAWGPGFAHLARDGEPRKRESDWRTPAGIYRIGAAFGFAPSSRARYVRVRQDETVCVDDLKSRAYNTITTAARVGPAVHVERMWTYPEYRHGLFIDYPSSHAHPADSCIFIHIWTRPGEPTAGCVGMPEARVVALQNFAEAGAVIAVFPRETLARFAGCLPDAAP